jgi:hypothetical protein
MKKEIFNIIASIVFILLFSFPSTTRAADITLAWDANPEDNVGGYKLYYKTGSPGPPYNGTDAYQGPSPIDIPVYELGNPSYPEYTLTDLRDDQIYYFTVTAYSNQDPNRESGFSNEVNNSGKDLANIEAETGGGGCFISLFGWD